MFWFVTAVPLTLEGDLDVSIFVQPLEGKASDARSDPQGKETGDQIRFGDEPQESGRSD
jgi:hypothetical protein